MSDKLTYEEIEEENKKLRQRVKELEDYIQFQKSGQDVNATKRVAFNNTSTDFSLPEFPKYESLTKDQIERYSRQLLMHEIGVQGRDIT